MNKTPELIKYVFLSCIYVSLACKYVPLPCKYVLFFFCHVNIPFFIQKYMFCASLKNVKTGEFCKTGNFFEKNTEFVKSIVF